MQPQKIELYILIYVLHISKFHILRHLSLWVSSILKQRPFIYSHSPVLHSFTHTHSSHVLIILLISVLITYRFFLTFFHYFFSFIFRVYNILLLHHAYRFKYFLFLLYISFRWFDYAFVRKPWASSERYVSVCVVKGWNGL